MFLKVCTVTLASLVSNVLKGTTYIHSVSGVDWSHIINIIKFEINDASFSSTMIVSIKKETIWETL